MVKSMAEEAAITMNGEALATIENLAVSLNIGWDGVAVFGTFALVIFALFKMFFPNYNKLEKEIESIKGSLTAIHNFLFHSDGFGKECKAHLESSEFLQAKSPVSLTEKGSERIEEIGIKRYIDSNLHTLQKHFDDTENEKEVVVHDIAQKLAKKLLNIDNARNNKDEDMLEILEKTYQDNASKRVIEDLFAVYLRDKVMEVKKGA